MRTITFEVHPITLTSPKNMLAIIFKSILILFTFDFLCMYFPPPFLSIFNLANNGIKEIIKYKNNHHSTIGFILSGLV